jgi:hypothetical protein
LHGGRLQIVVEQGVVYSIYHRTSYSYLTLVREGERELGVLDGGGEKRRSG